MASLQLSDEDGTTAVVVEMEEPSELPAGSRSYVPYPMRRRIQLRVANAAPGPQPAQRSWYAGWWCERPLCFCRPHDGTACASRAAGCIINIGESVPLSCEHEHSRTRMLMLKRPRHPSMASMS